VSQKILLMSGNVFYMMEYRETFLLLLKHFDETRQSRYLVITSSCTALHCLQYVIQLLVALMCSFMPPYDLDWYTKVIVIIFSMCGIAVQCRLSCFCTSVSTDTQSLLSLW